MGVGWQVISVKWRVHVQSSDACEMWIPFCFLIFSERSLGRPFLHSGHCVGIASVLLTPWSVHLKNASVSFGPCLFVSFWMINVKRSPWASRRRRQNNVLVACERNAHGSQFEDTRQHSLSSVWLTQEFSSQQKKSQSHTIFYSAFTPFNLRLCLSLCVHLIARTHVLCVVVLMQRMLTTFRW